MNCSAILRVPKKDAELSYKGLLSNPHSYKRSSISAKESGAAITFTVTASDVTALRASVNAVLRDIKVVEEATSAAIPQKQKK